MKRTLNLILSLILLTVMATAATPSVKTVSSATCGAEEPPVPYLPRIPKPTTIAGVVDPITVNTAQQNCIFWFFYMDPCVCYCEVWYFCPRAYVCTTNCGGTIFECYYP